MNVKDAQDIESSVSIDYSPPLQIEALDSGFDIDVRTLYDILYQVFQSAIQGYIDTKLSADTPLDDGLAFLQRVLEDFSSHPLFAKAVERVGSLSNGYPESTHFLYSDFSSYVRNTMQKVSVTYVKSSSCMARS